MSLFVYRLLGEGLFDFAYAHAVRDEDHRLATADVAAGEWQAHEPCS